MKLADYIETKKVELVKENNFRSIELRKIDKCTMSQFMTGHIFSFGEAKKEIDQSIEVEEVDRKLLGNTEINAIEVCFNVVKPRCRKPEYYSVYVKAV